MRARAPYIRMTQGELLTYLLDKDAALKILIGLAVLAMTLGFAACNEDGEEGEPSQTPAESASQTPEPGAYCSDEAVLGAVDSWVSSITLLVADEPELQLSDEEGMGADIETATRKFCEAGQQPLPEDVDLYCDGIVAAIDLRLDGPQEARDAFLTGYYNSCNAIDASPSSSAAPTE